MIRKRNVTIENETLEVPKRESPKFGSSKSKTWREEVFEVLDILEKEGINIYDENNHGGMYLNQQTKVPTKLKQIFSQNVKKVNIEPLEKTDPQLNNLFKFFKNNKNKTQNDNG
jgi:hypothetical protein